MEHKARLVFLALILAQAAHSIEECITKLYEVFAPARFVSSLISKDLALGFLIGNTALVVFGLRLAVLLLRHSLQNSGNFTG